MARYGKVLLQRLTFQYCDRMAASEGMRDYIQKNLPALKYQLPHVETVTTLKRNRFPYVKAEYALLPNDAAHLARQLRSQATSNSSSSNGSGGSQKLQGKLTSNVIGVKHCNIDQIREVVWWLCQSQNRPRTKSIPTKHIASKQPSIQGMWNASTFLPSS